jgi:hypothetical protein
LSTRKEEIGEADFFEAMGFGRYAYHRPDASDVAANVETIVLD